MVNTIFILDKTYSTTQILVGDKSSQRMFWDDTYTQEFDTGAESFEFSCYLNENVIEGNYVAFYYNNQYKLFTIMDMEQTHKEGRLVATCYCEVASLSLLNNYVRPFSGDMSCVAFFEHILEGTNWYIGKYSTSLADKVQTINVTSIDNVWSLIEDYKDIYECEINVRVTYENGHVTGQFIDLYSEGGLGSPTLKRFEYSRNVTGIVKQKDLYDWCTAIIVDCECDVNDTVIEESAGFGFTKGAGDIILDDNHNRMYNNGRNYVVGVYSGEETEPTEACINAWKELQKRSVPKFDYEVTTALTVEEYEEIHLGDTVYVVDHSYTPPLFLEARVGKLELSFTDRTQNKCTLTNYKEIKSKLLDADYIKLTGTIKDVVGSFFPIGPEGIQDGAIVDGKIDTTYFKEITADIVSASIGAFEELYVGNMTVINADIENLKAKYAEIDVLNSKYAEIDTLVNGHLTSDNIQSMIITGDKFTVADAFIKDAMIDTVNAGKINAGRLNTSLVTLSSEDGSMQLNGSLQQFKDSSGKVRIQIGKDAQGNFTFCLFSQDGRGVLIDETGIKEGAIGEGLIVDNMVSDNANISGEKLDISSVITQINGNNTLINSSKIFLDGENQSLEVAFDALKTKVETIEDVTIDGDLSSVIEQVTSNTTSINVMQGQINSLISNTTITKSNGQVVQLKDDYNSTKSTVEGNVTKIGSLESNYSTLTGELTDVKSKQASLEIGLNGFKTDVSSTYATKSQVDIVSSNATKALTSANSATVTAGNANTTANNALNKANANTTSIETITTKQSTLEQDVNKFKTTVSSTYATKGEVTNTYVSKTEFEQTSEDFTFRIEKAGGYNLLRNSDFYDAKNGNNWQYWSMWGTAKRYTSMVSMYDTYPGSFILSNTSTTEFGGLYQAKIPVKAGSTYTYSVNISWQSNVVGVATGVECYNSAGTQVGHFLISCVNNISTRQSITFTAPTGCTNVTIAFTHKCSTNGQEAYYILQKPCLVEGYSTVWSPHPKEISDGVVKINDQGITVKQGNSKTELNSTALNFYEGTNKYSHIADGRFYFTDPAGTKVGHVGRNTWVGTNTYLNSLNGEYGHTCAMAVQQSAGGSYTTCLIATGRDAKVTDDGYYYRGINLLAPHISGGMSFRYNSTVQYSPANGSNPWARPDMAIYSFDRDGNRMGLIAGNEALQLCIMDGDTKRAGFELIEDQTQTNKSRIEFWGPISMNGYALNNASLAYTLKPTTEYAKTLIDRGSTDYINYGSMSYNANEIRWCWKETVFTYAECDVDPATDEWVYTGRNICYIELPPFMAESIQNDYHVHIGKIGWGDYRVVEKTPYYFIVESKEEDFAFTFEVVATLLDSQTLDNNSNVANEYVEGATNISPDPEEVKPLEFEDITK